MADKYQECLLCKYISVHATDNPCNKCERLLPSKFNYKIEDRKGKIKK